MVDVVTPLEYPPTSLSAGAGLKVTGLNLLVLDTTNPHADQRTLTYTAYVWPFFFPYTHEDVISYYMYPMKVKVDVGCYYLSSLDVSPIRSHPNFN
jgi:hypothetical protein